MACFCMDRKYCFSVPWDSMSVCVCVVVEPPTLMKRKLLKGEITHSFASSKLSFRVFFLSSLGMIVSFRGQKVERNMLQNWCQSAKIPVAKNSAAVATELTQWNCIPFELRGKFKVSPKEKWMWLLVMWMEYGRVETTRNADFYPVHDLIYYNFGYWDCSLCLHFIRPFAGNDACVGVHTIFTEWAFPIFKVAQD